MNASPGLVRSLRWAIVLLIVMGGVSCVVKGADEPADPFLRTPQRTQVEGFGEIAFSISGMEAAKRCALLAEDEEQHSMGLMDFTDLRGYDGMLFVFERMVNDQFYMYQTPLPLSIAWFDSTGRFVSSTNMEPCLDRKAEDCPLYASTGPYRYALEVGKGGLPGLGIGPGSVLTAGGSC